MAAPKGARGASPPARGAHEEARAGVVVVDNSLERGGIDGLCSKARALVESGRADLLVCDLAGVAHPDLVVVDALARLQLTARRLGCALRLRHAGDDMRALLAFVGLADVVRGDADLGVEAGWQAEQREEALGVEEETDPGDDPV